MAGMVTISNNGLIGNQQINENELREMAKGTSVADRANLDQNRFEKTEISKQEMSFIKSKTFLGSTQKMLCEQFQTVIIFRCGRLHSDKDHPNCRFGPGQVTYYPEIDTGFAPKTPPVKIDLRDQIAYVPEHEFLTSDAKVVRSSATIVYQIIHPVKFVLNVRDALGSTILLCSSIMLEIGSKNNFSDLFQNKRELSKEILSRLDITTCNWGIRLERIDLDLKDMSKQLNKAFLNRFFKNQPSTNNVQAPLVAPPVAPVPVAPVQPIVINITNNNSKLPEIAN